MTFFVRFVTGSFGPPHSISMLTPLNEWQNIEGAYADGVWAFAVDDSVGWAGPGYFKFVLDERFWMDDPYIRIAPRPGYTYTFDEKTVSFEMSASLPTAPPPAPALPLPIPLPAISEGAVANRVVLLATPVITVAVAWIAGLVARHIPGVTLDQTQIVSFMIAVVGVCLAAAWKWLHGWQQHELLVAQRLAAPIKPVVSSPTIPEA